MANSLCLTDEYAPTLVVADVGATVAPTDQPSLSVIQTDTGATMTLRNMP